MWITRKWAKNLCSRSSIGATYAWRKYTTRICHIRCSRFIVVRIGFFGLFQMHLLIFAWCVFIFYFHMRFVSFIAVFLGCFSFAEFTHFEMDPLLFIGWLWCDFRLPTNEILSGRWLSWLKLHCSHCEYGLIFLPDKTEWMPYLMTLNAIFGF